MTVIRIRKDKWEQIIGSGRSDVSFVFEDIIRLHPLEFELRIGILKGN